MEIKTKITITFTGTLSLTEPEMRALEAMATYGTEAFLAAFYAHLGRAYMKPYEHGIKTLFESIRRTIPSQLARIDQVRRDLAEAKEKQ